MLKKPGEIEILEIPEPEPLKDEVLIRVHTCGICGSDVHAFAGKHPFVKYPVVFGHEFSGTIEKAGDSVLGVSPGTAVCVEPSLFCGKCPRCKSGRYNICDNLRVMGFQAPGAMCEYVSVPAHRVHVLPPGISLRHAALTEPAAVAAHALSRIESKSGWILVIGGGVIGLMLLSIAKAFGFHVVLVEANPSKAERARTFGADEVFAFPNNGEDLSPKRKGSEFEAIFECVGTKETIDLAIRTAPRGSTIVVVGVFSQPQTIPIEFIQDRELVLKGTLMYKGDDFELALSLLASGQINPERFISHSIPLNDVERGFRLLLDPNTETLKVLVEI